MEGKKSVLYPRKYGKQDYSHAVKYIFQYSRSGPTNRSCITSGPRRQTLNIINNCNNSNNKENTQALTVTQCLNIVPHFFANFYTLTVAYYVLVVGS